MKKRDNTEGGLPKGGKYHAKRGNKNKFREHRSKQRHEESKEIYGLFEENSRDGETSTLERSREERGLGYYDIHTGRKDDNLTAVTDQDGVKNEPSGRGRLADRNQINTDQNE